MYGTDVDPVGSVMGIEVSVHDGERVDLGDGKLRMNAETARTLAALLVVAAGRIERRERREQRRRRR